MESTDDGLITFDNKMWFKRISNEEAFRIRFDVQLYYIDVDGNLEIEWATPISWSMSASGWRDHSYYIQVDSPDKEEYEPSA